MYCHVGWFDCILSEINDDDDDDEKDYLTKRHTDKPKLYEQILQRTL